MRIVRGLLVVLISLAAWPVVMQAQTPPFIVSRPTPQTAIVGGRAIFTVIATGAPPLAYQWQKNTTNIAGATNDVLILTNVQFVSAGQYSVLVSNAAGITPGTNAALMVRNPVAGDPDVSFDPGSGINSSVLAVALQPDGKILIAGDFTSVVGAARGRVARLNPDFSTDHTFMNGLAGADATVSAMLVQSNGMILIGGSFATVNGSNRRYLARLRPDGSLDDSLPGTSSFYSGISAMALQPNGVVLLAAVTRVGRLDPDGHVSDSSVFVDGDIRAMASLPDGRILIGGSFTNVEHYGVDFERHFVARLGLNDYPDPAFVPALSVNIFDRGVSAVVPLTNGQVLVGGEFSNGRDIARLNANGSLDSGFPDLLPGRVESMVLLSDGRILAGGQFGLARLLSNGSLDPSFNNGFEVNVSGGSVSALAPQPDGKIVAGGAFSQVNGTNRNFLARLTSSGGLDPAQNPLSGFNGSVNSVALQPDGKLVIGGYFSSYRGTNRNGIARLTSAGELDAGFSPFTDGSVYSMLVQPDAKILLAGSFSSVNSVSRNNIARLDTNGVVDTTFNPGSGANSAIYSLLRQSDGRLIIQGYFTSYNGTNRNGLARLNSNGGLDTTFNPPSFDSSVYSMALQPDGKLLVAGGFSTVNGTNRNTLARLNANGGLDLSFNPGGGASNANYASLLALQADGKVLVGGYFQYFNGNRRSGLARVNADGTLDLSFNPGITPRTNDYTSISSLAVQSDGKILISGRFGGIDGQNTKNFSRLNIDGTRDITFDPGSGPNGDVNGITFLADGKIILTGSFGGVNGVAAAYLARAHSSPPAQPPVLIAVEPPNQAAGTGENASFRVSATGTLPISYQWRKDGTNLIASTNYIHAITNVQTDHAGSYSVVLSNAFGTATSSPAMLMVTPTAFASSGALSLPVGTNKANLYPSQITVAGYPWLAGEVTVTLSNLTHGRPEDLDILLVGPGGQKVMLMSDVGGNTPNAVTNISLTLADAAAVGFTTAKLTNGTFRPTDLAPGEDLPPPAPAGPYGTNLVVFAGTDPNGTWSLYVSDDTAATVGGSLAGWRLNLPRPAPPQILVPPQEYVSAYPCESATFTATAGGSPPLSYQWSFNGMAISGATNSSYTRSQLSMADEGNYYVVVTNFSGSVTSSTSQLSLFFAPTNDNFACHVELIGTNISFSTFNYGARAEPGEPSPSSASGAPATHSLWYKWVAPFTGGALIDATVDFTTPAVAVYTNKPGVSSVTNLAKVADNSSLFGKLRCAFTALAGQEYAIALDGSGIFDGYSVGGFNVSLTLTPPPANDLFSNATVITDTYFADAGSFLGASRETGEPNHGASNFLQTLWWSWTAPTNTANTNIPVRLTADAVSFPPAIGVYTGTSVNALAPVATASSTNHVNPGYETLSMTRETTFNATPGVTYRIALAGLQNLGNVISPRFGNFRFRFNTRALSLDVTNVTALSSGGFFGTVRIANLGPTNSGPLRVVIGVGSGVSVQAQDTGYNHVEQQIQSVDDLGSLSSGQATNLAVSGSIPATQEDQFTGIGWGVFIELEEQLLSGDWQAIDQALIGFGNWPSLNDNPGPGGGVIRLDPGYVGLSAFNPLLSRSVSILGAGMLPESSSTAYIGRAPYALGDVVLFSNTVWSVTPSNGFSITTNGLLRSGRVNSNTMLNVSARYQSAGIRYDISTNVLVSNILASLSGSGVLSNGTFAFALSGAPTQSYRLEAATNLPPPGNVWMTVTNFTSGTNGTFLFNDPNRTNLPRRFFRAVEQ